MQFVGSQDREAVSSVRERYYVGGMIINTGARGAPENRERVVVGRSNRGGK